jgi:hypothetical protein
MDMAKFMILFKSSLSASELMANATPEQVQASMNEWVVWKDSLDTAIGFEWGMPLQATAEITTTGVEDGQSPVSGYAIMEGDKLAITEVLKSHPHLKRDSASIDILEMLSMPGMQE